jgi:hypothetical protein
MQGGYVVQIRVLYLKCDLNQDLGCHNVVGYVDVRLPATCQDDKMEALCVQSVRNRVRIV